MTRRRAALILTALVLGIVGVTAAPASAHGLGGLTPTNYQSVLRSVSPRVPALHVRVTDLGTKVELTNDGAREVVVLGYAGEPYLRVGPKGVFENVRSPATYLNRSTTITGSPPKSADAKATPVWRHVSTGTTASWHDHRAHFMGGDDPPEVVRHPDQRRVVDNWVIPMRVREHRRRRARSADLRAAAVAVAVGRGRSAHRRAGGRALPHARVAHGVRRRAGPAHPHRGDARDRAVGRVDRVVRHQIGRERLFAGRHRARPARPRVDLAQRHRVGGATGARGHHLPVRGRRPRRRHQPRELPGAEHVLGRVRATSRDADPGARRGARGGGRVAVAAVVARSSGGAPAPTGGNSHR